ncbi:hypothetical protein GGI00_002714, partial [Coemansia sp. RSA 2681]
RWTPMPSAYAEALRRQQHRTQELKGKWKKSHGRCPRTQFSWFTAHQMQSRST